MLEHSIYSVISPEGAASILWRDTTRSKDAATNMKITAQDLLELKIIDGVIAEPLGGAHRDPHQMATRLKVYLVKTLRELSALDRTQLLQERYEKFRRMGVFLEDTAPTTADPTPT